MKCEDIPKYWTFNNTNKITEIYIKFQISLIG